MIELQNVSKTVMSGDRPLTILHPLTLIVPAGQLLSIVGPSGSGKSTLLGLIAGLDAPSDGSIFIDGINITAMTEDQLARLRGEKIGFVFQFFHLIPSLSALENVRVPLEIAGSANSLVEAKQLLDEVGLEERGHHYPSQLSGGEQQRIAIARALANKPQILLADEPTGNLDSKTELEILNLFDDLHKEGKTIILVTHSGEVAERAQRVVRMKDGLIESDTILPESPSRRKAQATK